MKIRKLVDTRRPTVLRSETNICDNASDAQQPSQLDVTIRNRSTAGTSLMSYLSIFQPFGMVAGLLGGFFQEDKNSGLNANTGDNGLRIDEDESRYGH